MTLPVFWLSEADADLKDARAWYDNVRTELGQRFADAVDETIERISEGQQQFSVVHRNIRRAGVRRFPYGIFFETQESRVVVVACFHGRRDPRVWRQRG